MSLTYTSYVATLSSLTLIPSDNSRFQSVLPSCIDYAEQRIYRELDLIAEDVSDASATTTPNDRRFTLPTSKGTFQIITEINIITPAGSTPQNGTRHPCVPTSRSFLDWSWPDTTGASIPTQFCYFTQANLAGFTQSDNIIFGPWPDQAYTVEVIGKIIPTPLSVSNTQTFLSLYLPDLFIAASMVFMNGAMKNFGGQSDDPRQALSWEQVYNEQKASAMTWEARKRFAGASWTAKPIEPTAVPQRG